MLEKFANLVHNYNKTHNITGAKSLSEINKNIQDSVGVLKHINIDEFGTIVDVGSGAGFPAIPLALRCQNAQFYLFEPIKKKSSFLIYAKSALVLSNVHVVNEKVQNHIPLRADLIISRAVCDTDTLLKLASVHASKDTKALLYKGSEVQSELNNIKSYEIYNNGNRNYLLISNPNNYEDKK